MPHQMLHGNYDRPIEHEPTEHFLEGFPLKQCLSTASAPLLKMPSISALLWVLHCPGWQLSTTQLLAHPPQWGEGRSEKIRGLR